MHLTNTAKIALFADNALLYSTGVINNLTVKKLQQQLDKMQLWFDQWYIMKNTAKTSKIIFSNKLKIFTPKIKIQGTTLDWSNSIKYLGVYIDLIKFL